MRLLGKKDRIEIGAQEKSGLRVYYGLLQWADASDEVTCSTPAGGRPGRMILTRAAKKITTRTETATKAINAERDLQNDFF